MKSNGRMERKASQRRVVRLGTLAVMLVGVLAAACSSQQEVTVRFETSEPLRVMVLPFVQVDESSGEIVQPDAEHFVDGVPLVSEKLAEDPPELLRQMVQTELQHTAFDVLSPYLVNIELPHHGFGRPDGSFDVRKIYSATARELCTHFLDCDAVLYGWVTEWDRSYYGVQTVNSVTLRLQLVSARTEKVLYEIEASNSSGRGLSGGPTGISDLVLEPIRGLDSEQIENVARVVAAEAVAPLKVQNQPEYKKTPPPLVAAVAHTFASQGAGSEQIILVLLYGSPGMRARFSIGEQVQDFPMTEVEPGHYVGEYTFLPTDRFEDEPIAASLTDRFGRRSEQISASGRVSAAKGSPGRQPQSGGEKNFLKRH